VCEMVT